jgi:hypothetical protein
VAGVAHNSTSGYYYYPLSPQYYTPHWDVWGSELIFALPVERFQMVHASQR